MEPTRLTDIADMGVRGRVKVDASVRSEGKDRAGICCNWSRGVSEWTLHYCNELPESGTPYKEKRFALVYGPPDASEKVPKWCRVSFRKGSYTYGSLPFFFFSLSNKATRFNQSLHPDDLINPHQFPEAPPLSSSGSHPPDASW